MTPSSTDETLRDPGAGRATSRLLAAYLTLTLVPLLGGGIDGSRVLVATGHLATAALLLRTSGTGFLAHRRRTGPARAFVHWLPLLLVPLLYAELPLLNQTFASGYQDAHVLRWEALLFGGNPARSWAGAFPDLFVSEILHLSYLSYYGLIYVPPLMLWASGRHRAFDATVFTLMLAFVLCFLAFIAFPVQGPRYLFPAPPGVPEGPVRGVVLAILEAGSSRGAAFPSSHMAVAVAQTLLALRFQRRVGIAVALLTAGLGAGAVYGGFHYAVDIVAGAVIGGLAAFLYAACRGLGNPTPRRLTSSAGPAASAPDPQV